MSEPMRPEAGLSHFQAFLLTVGAGELLSGPQVDFMQGAFTAGQRTVTDLESNFEGYLQRIKACTPSAEYPNVDTVVLMHKAFTAGMCSGVTRALTLACQPV